MMKNEAYPQLKDFSRKYGMGKEQFEEHLEILPLYDKTMDEIRQFDGKKAKLTYKATSDWLSHGGEMVGKIRVRDDKILFFEGRKTTRFNYLDAGLFEGFFAVLIPISIDLFNKEG
jgi:hypothetical protein